MESLAGHLLIAVPELGDKNFFRSVVLVLHHDSFGASGVVLNRPTDVSIDEVWESSADPAGKGHFDLTDLDGKLDGEINQTEVLYVGGPVEGPLIALHQDRDLADEKILSGVFMSTRRDTIERLVRLPDCQMRLFAGYSGWGPQQLDSEVQVGGWMVTVANASHVYGEADTLWQRACEVFSEQVVEMPARGQFDPKQN